MTRINTNVSSLTAQTRLQRTNNDLQTALTRLSTGLRINSGKDDPAGLIASESLRSDITSINKALSNTQRASQIIATADSALGQVSSLLNDIRGLVTEAANKGALSDDEIAANQLQVDSSLEAINRIAQTTTFQGRKLLDGSLDFITKAGTGFGTVSDLKIDQANLGATGKISVNVSISSAATKAEVRNSGIPATASSSGYSTGTLTFGTTGAAVDAVVDVALANSYVVGAEASKNVQLSASYTNTAQATATNVTLGDSGINFDLTAAVDGEADGLKGNSTIVQVTTKSSGATTASYDADTNILTLDITVGATHTAIATAINTDGTFVASGATAGSTTATLADAGTSTGLFTGGAATVVPGSTNLFTLSAVNGGIADGEIGNATTLQFTTGTTRGAVYDADTNSITVTVQTGDTISDIANQINTDLSGDFLAANVSATYEDYLYSSTNNGLNAGAFTGGTNTTTASQFRLQATTGGLAGGTVGNTTDIVFATGTTTAATYDAVANRLNVTVADLATVDQVAAAIDTEGTFQLVPGQTLNGTALFSIDDSTDDFGTNTPTVVTTGTSLDGVITVTAKEKSVTFNKNISVVQSNAIAAGTASAALDSSGNIIVSVRNAGTVNLTAIRDAINTLDDYEASITNTGNTDGIYDIDNESAPTIANLTGGGAGGGLIADLVFNLTGGTGTQEYIFDQGTSLANIVASINLNKDATGVEAADDAGELKLTSTSYGSKATVAIEVIKEGVGGTFETGLSSSRESGKDIVASVNGYNATGDGNSLSISTSSLELSLTVDAGSSTAVNFDIVGGGALFQLGSDVVSNQQARLGIGSLSTGKLGGPSGRLYELKKGQAKSLANDITGAAEVIDSVINKVTSLRGRLGAFQRTALESNVVSLSDTLANLNEAQSSIRDADFAKESANLTRAQVLVQSGTSVLGIANRAPRTYSLYCDKFSRFVRQKMMVDTSPASSRSEQSRLEATQTTETRGPQRC